jgi:hypothetical protein
VHWNRAWGALIAIGNFIKVISRKNFIDFTRRSLLHTKSVDLLTNCLTSQTVWMDLSAQFSYFCDSVEDGKQLSHASNQESFLRLTGGDEPVIGDTDHRVEANSD